MSPLSFDVFLILFSGSLSMATLLSVSSTNQLCERIAKAQFCDSSFTQEYVNMLYCCNETDAAAEEINQCRYKSTGDYCNFDETYDLLINANSACENHICSEDCTYHLINIRKTLGCCINDFRATGDISGAHPLDQSVWGRCNVSEPRNMTCPSKLVEKHDLIIDPSCSGRNAAELIYPYLCRKDYRQPLQKKLSQTSGCKDFELPSCRANRDNQYCEILPLETIFLDALNACENRSKCGGDCYKMLQTLLKEADCCINEKYNNTDSGSDYNWLSNSFWVECGLQTPGHCEERLTKGASVALYTKQYSFLKIAGIAAAVVLGLF